VERAVSGKGMVRGLHPSKRIIGSGGKVLSGRKVVLGISGSVAAFKAPEIARALMRQGAEVVCVMSRGARSFIGSELMHWATGNEVVTEITARTEHVELLGDVEGRADVLLIAPATSSTIARIANGLEEGALDLMAATAMGSGVPVIMVPAMHQSLYQNPMLGENVRRLEKAGVVFVSPRIEAGKAKMAYAEEIVDFVARESGEGAGRLKGKKAVVTAGATREFIDDVRFISNPSTGRMGVEVARRAWQMGADVLLVAGHLDVNVPGYLKCIRVENAREMRGAVLSHEADIYVLAGAPGDFEVAGRRRGKMDSGRRVTLELVPVPKIAGEVKERYPRARMVIFKAEADADMLEKKALERMEECRADIAVANLVGKDRGFGSREGEFLILGCGRKELVSGGKSRIADEILSRIRF